MGGGGGYESEDAAGSAAQNLDLRHEERQRPSVLSQVAAPPEGMPATLFVPVFPSPPASLLACNSVFLISF